jgi:hypothetical protein
MVFTRHARTVLHPLLVQLGLCHLAGLDVLESVLGVVEVAVVDIVLVGKGALDLLRRLAAGAAWRNGQKTTDTSAVVRVRATGAG